MRKISLSILLILLSVFVLSCKNKKRIHESDLYLGQKPPGTSPEVFSPGIISANEKNHSCVAISSDGREAYWSLFFTISGVRQERIWTSILEEGVWTKTRLVPTGKGGLDSHRTAGGCILPHVGLLTTRMSLGMQTSGLLRESEEAGGHPRPWNSQSIRNIRNGIHP